jgi:hypothetical protein
MSNFVDSFYLNCARVKKGCGAPVHPAEWGFRRLCTRACYSRYQLKFGVRSSRIPSPQEVARRTAANRGSWSPEERLRRLRPDWRALLGWQVPTASTEGLPRAEVARLADVSVAGGDHVE